MKLIADYHIHSNNSKFGLSKASIEEIARKANSVGLKEIAITDHGFKHFFATSKDKLIKARELIDELNESMGIKILLGIEADVISAAGDIDVDDETLQMIDMLLIGYHKMIKTDFATFFGGQRKNIGAIEKATDAFINAISRYNVDIVAHPGNGLKLNLYRLGKFCAENSVFIELNNRHHNYTKQEINDLIRSGCEFVVSSDAKNEFSVGNVDRVIDFVLKNNIPTERIINYDFGNGKRLEIDKEIEEDMKKYNELFQNNKNERKAELSDETEKRLNDIAREKGLIEDNQEEVDYKLFLTPEERRIVERAEEFLKNHKK